MAERYTSFTVTDFLTDDFFINHHLKPTPESTKFWKDWVDNSWTNEYKEAVEVLQVIRMGLTTYEHTTLSAEAKLFVFNRIQETNQKATKERKQLGMWRWVAAAAVVLILGMGYVFLSKTSSYKRNLEVLATGHRVEKKAVNAPLLIHLPDGSAVKLLPRSKISFPAEFDKEKRVVILSGEATFDIAKDPARPFLVMANEVITKVLGTRFNVKAYENLTNVVVTVEEGKVSVFKNSTSKKVDNELKGVILLPNQQAIFDRSTDQYNKKLIGTPTILNAHEQPSFDFEETPLKEVMKRLEIAYGIEIVFDEVLLSDCQVTGRFETESLFQKLDIITKTIGGSYEVVEGKIVINSRGCH